MKRNYYNEGNYSLQLWTLSSAFLIFASLIGKGLIVLICIFLLVGLNISSCSVYWASYFSVNICLCIIFLVGYLVFRIMMYNVLRILASYDVYMVYQFSTAI